MMEQDEATLDLRFYYEDAVYRTLQIEMKNIVDKIIIYAQLWSVEMAEGLGNPPTHSDRVENAWSGPCGSYIDSTCIDVNLLSGYSEHVL